MEQFHDQEGAQKQTSQPVHSSLHTPEHDCTSSKPSTFDVWWGPRARDGDAKRPLFGACANKKIIRQLFFLFLWSLLFKLAIRLPTSVLRCDQKLHLLSVIDLTYVNATHERKSRKKKLPSWQWKRFFHQLKERNTSA
eukprot:1157531-Pelagomonas_calceolata.AAC.11